MGEAGLSALYLIFALVHTEVRWYVWVIVLFWETGIIWNILLLIPVSRGAVWLHIFLVPLCENYWIIRRSIFAYFLLHSCEHSQYASLNAQGAVDCSHHFWVQREEMNGWMYSRKKDGDWEGGKKRRGSALTSVMLSLARFRLES